MHASDNSERFGGESFSPSVFLALLILAVCLIATIYGYFIKPPIKTGKPPHVLFRTNGGPVLFPHLRHSHKEGGAFECIECHHKLDEEPDSADMMRCRNCHYENADVVEAACADGGAHPRCIGRRCNTCHEGEECNFCHRKQQ